MMNTRRQAKLVWRGAASALLFLTGCGVKSGALQTTTARPAVRQEAAAPRPSSGSPFLDKLVEAAVERTTQQVRYDPAYFSIGYPGGDVPPEVGVCTDEVIRSYRKVGVDLQKEVHEDMARNFHLYPRKWGLKKTDTNIDHRRVPNLMVFFERQGAGLAPTDDARDYKPGDIVTWDLGGQLTHIGIVVNVPSPSDTSRLMIVHNIGAGPQMEDVLFNWKITGHYRYTGPKKTVSSKQ
ncbi:MAG: DUF1287 domain-containing protein [Acidobacteria bacterium]|nr:DUF1287 domain-containing protein [Acidobacteriota bacterium]